MKKEKLKEIGRFVILWAIGLSIALLTSCVRVNDCDTYERDVYINGFFSHTEVETICYY